MLSPLSRKKTICVNVSEKGANLTLELKKSRYSFVGAAGEISNSLEILCRSVRSLDVLRSRRTENLCLSKLVLKILPKISQSLKTEYIVHFSCETGAFTIEASKTLLGVAVLTTTSHRNLPGNKMPSRIRLMNNSTESERIHTLNFLSTYKGEIRANLQDEALPFVAIGDVYLLMRMTDCLTIDFLLSSSTSQRGNDSAMSVLSESSFIREGNHNLSVIGVQNKTKRMNFWKAKDGFYSLEKICSSLARVGPRRGRGDAYLKLSSQQDMCTVHASEVLQTRNSGCVFLERPNPVVSMVKGDPTDTARALIFGFLSCAFHEGLQVHTRIALRNSAESLTSVASLSLGTLRPGLEESAISMKLVIKPMDGTPSSGHLCHKPTDINFLISGGTSGIGMLVSFWAALEVGKNIAVHGRNGLLKEGSFDGHFAWFEIQKSDSSFKEDSLQTSRLSYNLLHGNLMFIHSSGVQRETSMTSLAPEDMRITYAPKVVGMQTQWGSVFSSITPVTQEILFSSLSAVIGSKAHSNYAACNSALDAISSNRSLCGLPSTSTQWGAWSSIGKKFGFAILHTT